MPAFPLAASAETEGGVLLTSAERDWLKAHPVIRVVQTPDWHPVEFEDPPGSPAGISEDYLRIIEGRLGIKFTRVTGVPWDVAYPALRKNKIDMVTAVVDTPERRAFWSFTKPHIKMPVVAVTRQNVLYVSDLQELSGRTVASGKDYATTSWIARDYPDIRLMEVLAVRDGLEAVRSGKAYAYVDAMMVCSYYLTAFKMRDLKIGGPTPYSNNMSMAVRKDWAPLAGILQKALDSVTEEEKRAIYGKWVPPPYENWLDTGLFMRVTGVLGTIVLLLGIHNRILSKQVAARKKAEAGLREINEVLAEKRSDMTSFLRVFSYDMTVPLSTVKYYGAEVKKNIGSLVSSLAEIPMPGNMRGELKELVDVHIGKGLGFILGGSEKLERMVESLRKVARLERTALPPEKVDMDSVLKGVLANLQDQLEQAGAAVIGEPLVPCTADPVAIGQVFMTLIDNAVRYRSPERELAIRIRSSVENGMVLYSVSDNGSGVPAESLSRLGQAFYRVNPGQGDGEGIGLVMVKRILDLNGGHLRAERGRPWGMVFTFSLPSAGDKRG